MRFPLLFPVLVCTLVAQEPLPVHAPITRVRLHPDEAWVTRVGEVHLTNAGTVKLVIKDLPPGLRLEDLRVSAKGPEGSRLGDLAVNADVRVVTETAGYKGLIMERDGLRDRRDALEAEGEALAQELAFLKNLQATYDKDISAKLAGGPLDPSAILNLSKGLQGRLGEIFGRDRKRKHELDDLSREGQGIQQELDKRLSGRTQAPSRVMVEITAMKAGLVQLELSYRTRAARWDPAYEARLRPDGKKVELVLFAALNQRSGEDWKNVQVEVTNSKASRSLTLAEYAGPQAVAWSGQNPNAYANPRGRQSGAACTVEVVATSFSVNGSNMSDSRSAPAQTSFIADAVPAEAARVEESRGLASTWVMDGYKDVPSDGEPHRFRVLSREIEPTMALVSSPRLDPTVFQVARFPMPSGIPLFPGAPIVHFAGTQRLGQANLAIPAPGQPVSLGFGPYRGVRVVLRQVEAKKETAGTFTKETLWTLKERIELTNDMEEACTVEIQDREFRAANDKVNIATLKESTPSMPGTIPGIRNWKLDLPARSNGVIQQGFIIKVPMDGWVSGLGTLHLPE